MNNKLNVSKAIFALLTFTLSVGFTSSSYAGDEYKTEYPIVLVHGLFGFDDVFGLDYFYGVSEMLTEGGATVYTAKVSAANTSEVRGEQLLSYVEKVRAKTGKSKVHLIGHSHGGPTTRYVASIHPEYVASVTSIGGVNWGTPVADIVRGTLPEDSLPESVIGGVANAMSGLIDFLAGDNHSDQSSIGATESLTTIGSLLFNKKYPEGLPAEYCGKAPALADNGVYYYSWSGGSALTNVFDGTDAFLTTTSWAFNEPSDGLVSSCSSHLGEVIKDNYKMNHIDEVNHMFGIHHLFEIDPLTPYSDQVKRLVSMGL